jgi:hypothetical protein
MGVCVHTVAGFRNKDLVILEDEFSAASDKFVKVSDDGSWGDKGLVTNALKALLDSGEKDAVVQLVDFAGGAPTVSWREVRPLPEGGGFFENVWREYRIHKNIY